MGSANGAGSVLSLPKGGGAQQSIGETFTADLFTGTGNASIALALPPGRNGFAPGLSLSYGSGSGNGPFGIGWNISIPQVARRTTYGVPTYDDATDTFSAGADSLVRNAPNADSYTQRTVGQFVRIRHRREDTLNEWTVETREGQTSVYGPEPSSRIVDPASPERIFAWLLARTKDPFGNTIEYGYTRTNGASREYEEVLPSTIRYVNYGAGPVDYLAKVEFVYEDRPDHVSSRRAGFEMRTTKRVSAVVISTVVQGVERLFRRYRITYHPDTPDGNGASLLQRVVVESDDGTDTEALPPVEYTYVPFDPAARTFSAVTGSVPVDSLADPDQNVADLYGCGLPGILRMDGTPRFWGNAGDCAVQEPRLMRDSPGGFNLADPGVALLDCDGDGRLDLMINNGSVAGYFPASRDGNWDAASFQPWQVAPSFDPKDPRVRLVDLDGNGVTDALRSGARIECFFNDPSEGWNATRLLERGALPGLDLDFTDPRVFLADMTGDGLQDVVLVQGGSVTYWPSLGRGRFGTPVRMSSAPRLPYGYDPRRVVLGDVDGDGAADLLYIDDGRTYLWINRSGHAFATGFVCEGTPAAGDSDAFRLVDFSGGGIAGLLYSRAANGDGRANYHFLDFTGGRKPYLLANIESGAMMTEIDFVSSTRYYLEDAKHAATRWKTCLPFPVQVVAAVRRREHTTGNLLTTVYAYRHGYWDGVEREFRGFGRVAQRDIDETHASDCPPTLTVSWFNLGPVGTESEWTMPTFAEEYWSGDAPYLPAAVLPENLKRRDQRDAARALRGTLMRAELYGLDGTPFSAAPYTVTEDSTVAVLIVAPTNAPTGRGAFFPCATAKRVTQWERGDDPRTTANFWKHFDAYGQPCLLIDVAVPRGRDFRATGQQDLAYLVGTTSVRYAIPLDPSRYQPGCLATVTQRQFPNDGSMTLDTLITAIVAEPARGMVTAQTFHYYDGEPFVGLPLGSIGAWGAQTRVEQYAFSRETLIAAYASPDGAKVPPYLEPGVTPPWTDDYPVAFREQLAPLAGYLYYAPDDSVRAPGYWFNAERTRYDVQTGTGCGMKMQTLDPMGNATTYAYDTTALLPSSITDPLGLSTYTRYDERLLTPSEQTDENGNRQRVRRSPLGFQTARWIMGKPGEAVGDTEAKPSSRWTYDLFAHPVSIRTVQRECYASDESIPPADRDATVASVQYLDGFGRSLQVRNQAEDVVYGDLFGRIAFDSAWKTTSVRVRREQESVAISAAQRYDFKGRVIEKYQPVMGSGWAYAASEHGASTHFRYDPRGMAERTINADGSMRLTVRGIPLDLTAPGRFAPNPWDTYLYDENDNAGRTDPVRSKPWESQWNTPGSSTVDALGRTVIAVERNGIDPSNWLTTTSTYDLVGNLLTVTDALGRLAFSAIYDRRQKRLRTELSDSGVQRFVLDAAGREIETRDAKGALTLSGYDVASRNTSIWARDNAQAAVTRRQKIVYGDDPESGLTREQAAQHNLLTRPYLVTDDLGTLRYEDYDFKGNQVRKTRRVEANLGLDFETAVHFDALDRVRTLTTPADAEGNRHVLVLGYDRAGALARIRLDDKDIVLDATYCAQGDRTSLTYAGGVEIGVEYDPLRFWPVAIRTERAGPTPELLQANRYTYDLVGNPLEIESSAPGCGLPPSPDRLKRSFRYDALYRLLGGDGRESGEARFPPWVNNARPQGVENSRAYAEAYEYDDMNNLIGLDHRSESGAWRRVITTDPACNRVTEMAIGGDRVGYGYDGCGNVITESARRFGWDYHNRLVSFDSGAGVHADYLRDGTGVRTVQRISEANRVDITVYIDDLLEYRQVEADGAVVKGTLLHIRDGNRHLAIVRYGTDPTGGDGPALTLQIPDELGSSTIALGLDGWKNVEEYAPYGETVYGSYPAKRYRFTDHRRDEESALYDTEARAYMPWLGRWLSADPLGLADGPNPYAYVSANPLRYVDPHGTQGEENQQTNSARASTSGVSDTNPRALATGSFNLLSGLKWAFQPRNHATGAWLHEMYNLWSGNDGKTLASKAFGYIMAQTSYHQDAIKYLMSQGWKPNSNMIMPAAVWTRAWDMSSFRAARDAALSMVPVRGFGTADATSVQTRIEWPAVLNYGALRALLVHASGLSSIVAGAVTHDNTDRAFLLTGGMMQLQASKFWGVGVVGPHTMAMVLGSRMFAFGGLISAIPTLLAVPGAYQRNEWQNALSMSASGTSPAVMLTGMLMRQPAVVRGGVGLGLASLCFEMMRLGYGWIGPPGGGSSGPKNTE
ncbi:MAG TPA: SpvB/TcaC N-terminal domain-containing protein [Paraburkholderia sp.]|uniref:SpvB/TcaC N-terminal domain-containing protein n=1 Tax=Paraburkholderia sp. TaxID=1926495 RepID=UPI002C200965|nr:SpvB/TcaC N-terminal domain-containing protein [Paraburkholderia sp.]HTR05325.1 SpvB/TcaC N-terminal domain-containing protein [Paraburkholderia sp.]